MHEKRYLVLDIETIMDRFLVSQVFGISPDADQELLQQTIESKYSSGFLPAPFQRPVCIALIDVDHETCRVQNATVMASSDEKSLIQQFWKIVKYRKGTTPVKTVLVHFNGRCFDLPVLFYRSLKHRIPVVPLEDRTRFSFESSHDICDDLSEFGATSKPSLDVISKMLGFPGKTGIDGSQIESLYAQGDWQTIKDYCMQDTLNTYYIWLTIKLIRNQIDETGYREAIDNASDIVTASRTYTDPFFVAK